MVRANLWAGGRDRFGSAQLGTHPTVKVAPCGLAVVQRLCRHAQGRGSAAVHLARPHP